MDSPEQKEMDGHSYMNKGELDIVHNYINKICSELHVKPEDIGVVSPYSCQVALNQINVTLKLGFLF